MIEDLPNYDAWKLAAPPGPSDVFYVDNCVECGEKLYEGDGIIEIEHVMYCEICGKEELERMETEINDFTTEELFDELFRRAGHFKHRIEKGDSYTVYDEKSRVVTFVEGPAELLIRRR